MPRSTLRYLLLPVVLLAMLLAASPSVADDEEDGGEGQGEVDGQGPDAPDGQDDGERPDFQNQPASEEELDVAFDPEFHPTYRLDHTRDQDVASWTHAFTMNYQLSKKLHFRATSNINTRSNDALNRTNRQETWTAGLDMNVSDAITTGLRFRRTKHVDVQNEGDADETRSGRQKESVNLSTSFNRTYGRGITVALGATAGLEKNEYADVKSDGAAQSITAGLRFAPIEALNTSFDYSGNHSLLDSEQGELVSKDESIDHSLSSKIDYRWSEHSFSVDLRRGTGTKEYPKQGQTEVREQESEAATVSSELELMDGMNARLSFNYGRNQSYYRVEPSNNNDIITRGVQGHVTYEIGKTSYKVDMGSDRKRNEYFDVQTGTNYSNSFTLNISHKFSDKLDAAFQGRTSLLSIHYDDTEANDQDRDLHNQNASLTVNYKPRVDISTGISIKVKEDQLIYIRTSRTGDNKTTRTFAIEPFIRKSFTPRFNVNQRYQLSADYTFYRYDEDSNFLIRNMSVITGITWRPMDALQLTIDHTYRVQDEGAYIKDEFGVEKYGKDSEREDQKVGIGLKYALFDLIDIEVRQELSVQEKWRIEEEGKIPSWDKFDTSIVGKASTEYSLPDGTTLSATVARTHRDATSISDRQREVWNITLKANRTF